MKNQSEPRKLTDEEKKQAKEIAKRLKDVLKELKKKFRPQSIKERIGYSMMLNMFINEVVNYVETEDPAKTREALETFIKRLMWIIEEK